MVEQLVLLRSRIIRIMINFLDHCKIIVLCAIVTSNDGIRLVAVQAGARYYDAAAQTQRMTCPTPEAAKELEIVLAASKAQSEAELEETLLRELLGQRKPRNKPVAKSVLNNAIAQ